VSIPTEVRAKWGRGASKSVNFDLGDTVINLLKCLGSWVGFFETWVLDFPYDSVGLITGLSFLFYPNIFMILSPVPCFSH
jgi:hypothetical protein